MSADAYTISLASYELLTFSFSHRGDVPSVSVLPLLQAGFNRRIIENDNEKEWLNELQILDHYDVHNQVIKYLIA